MCVFHVSDGTVLKRLSCGCVCGVSAVTFSPDGTMLAVAVQVRTLQSYLRIVCGKYIIYKSIGNKALCKLVYMSEIVALICIII